VPPLVFGLLIVAGLLHVGWNVLVKTAGDPLRTVARASTASLVVVVPLAIVAWFVLGQPEISPQVVGLAVVSGLLEVVYFVFLSAAYRRGGLSLVYPIARGTAPVLAAAVGVVVLFALLTGLTIATYSGVDRVGAQLGPPLCTSPCCGRSAAWDWPPGSGSSMVDSNPADAVSGLRGAAAGPRIRAANHRIRARPCHGVGPRSSARCW
jgi:multidrug transporter EmrE-like cation transporter